MLEFVRYTNFVIIIISLIVLLRDWGVKWQTLQRSLAHAEQLQNDAEMRRRVDERRRLDDEQTAHAAAKVPL